MAPMGNIVAETRIVQGEKVHVKAGIVEIKSYENNPRCAEILIDGVKVPRVRKVTVSFEAGQCPVATIEVLCLSNRSETNIVFDNPKSEIE